MYNPYEVVYSVLITEKATALADKFNKYTFKVNVKATKPQIARAVAAIFDNVVVSSVNVMNYAYPAGTTGYVNISASVNAARLKITISDNGVPFDPTAKAEVDTTLSVEERGIGGLGIHLIRQIMDSINYEHVDGKNVLTLRKKLTQENKQ